jgi:hypothetical protein
MLKPLSQARIKVLDRRRAPQFHEAGHVTMARHLGFPVAWAELEEIPG